MNRRLPCIIALMWIGWTSQLNGAERPQYVDLRPVVNGNTDYIRIWPPVVFGDVERNGYRFRVINPVENGNRNVLSVSGERALTVPVPDMKGQYVYVLHHTTNAEKGAQPYYRHAIYTIQYADGTTADIPIRDSRETHQWWARDWWSQLKRDGATSAWPFFYGRSYMSMKYGYGIGVWAMQWRNAHPDKAITGISFKPVSSSKSVIYAITIADTDYFDNPQKNEYVRTKKKPGPPIPEDYFKAESDAEQRGSYKLLRKQDQVKGVREIELIRPDTLEVKIDAAISQGAGLDEERARAFQVPERFAVHCAEDPDFAKGLHPSKVGRLSLHHDTHNLRGFGPVKVWWHSYYLVMPAPLKKGNTYKVMVDGLEEGLSDFISIAYSDRETVTPIIKVNQAAYSLASKRRYAYLGWWAGDLGRMDYAQYKIFQVIDEDDNSVAMEGTPTLRNAGDDASGEDIYEMDLAPLTKVGQYHVYIPGLGRSFSFGLGGKYAFDNFRIMMQGMMHYRCGAEVTKDISDWPHPPCHVWSYENGHLVYGRRDRYDKDGKHIPADVPHKPDEPKKAFYGGYHDAGDTDLHYEHLTFSANLLTVYAINPAAFKDSQLLVPERGNGLPDILDEVAWGLKFYADNQQEDGGILGGRINDEDDRHAWKKNWAQYFNRPLPPYGNFPACAPASFTFAAVAAQFSRALKSIDTKKADWYLAKARKAYTWAESHCTDKYERQGTAYKLIPLNRATAWAAFEMFLATKEEKFHQDFLTAAKDKSIFRPRSFFDFTHFYWWPYASATVDGMDVGIREMLRKKLLDRADHVLKNTDEVTYRLARKKGSYGMLAGGGLDGVNLLRAYLLTGEQKYIDAASLNADWQFGGNPLSRSYVAGIGDRPVLKPSTYFYSKEGLPAAGSQANGPTYRNGPLGDRYPDHIPGWRSFLDVRNHHRYMEGRGNQSAIMHGILWVLENR